MRLKVLIVPFFIVMILVLSIGYIQPGLGILETQKVELAKKSNQVANIESVVNNVDALSQSLDNKKELTQFMERYLPKQMDQGRVIDAFNFLTTQTGLSITDMAMEESLKVTAVVEPVVNPATGEVVSETVFKDPVAESYIASVKVRGSYENIKAFFDRISHMDRFHMVNDFAIETPKETEATTDAKPSAPKTTGNLMGTFKARFDYFPGRAVKTAMAIPIFSKSEFDFSVPKKALDRITSPIADLEYTAAGKPNPFQ